MRCYNGIYIKKQGAIRACGQCMACRINKGRKWTVRILMEQSTTNLYSWFQTYTYADSTLPLAQNTDYVPTLKKKRFLKWLDNQQQAIGPFRYYAVGEYGERFGRPHYHAAIFPTHDGQITELRRAWRRRFGHTDEIELNPKLARYLAQYAAKKLTAPDDYRLEENQEPEFRESSRRPPLGRDLTDQIAETYRSGNAARVVADRGDIERTIRLHGRIYPLPDWSLARIRKTLGIPLRHEDRAAAHPNYLDWHEIQEAECDLDKHRKRETLIRVQNTQKTLRNNSL